DVEARILALTLRLGGDRGTQNIDRILRLPDTINLPNAKKRKAGRTECQAKLLWFDDVSYPLDAFPSVASAPFATIETGISEAFTATNRLKVASEFANLSVEDLGEGIKSPDETGSGHGFRFMLDCHAQGMNYEQARAAILADKTKAGEWANRVDERPLERAWKHSEPKPKPDSIAIPAVNAEITRLAALSTVEYEHEREAAAENLKVRVVTLDKLVTKKQAPPPQLGTGGLQDDLALKFSTTYAANVRYVAAWSKWFHWDNVRWVEEKTLHAFHLARDICRKANQQAADHTMVAGVIALARTDRRRPAPAEQWDAAPWLLGTPEGTIDLHTGKLSPPKPTDYITKITAVTPSNKPPRDSCPLWLTFLNRVTNS